LVLINAGDESASLDRVELEPGDAGAAEVVEVRLLDKRAHPGALIGTAHTYEPPAGTIPAGGATIAPGGRYEILFGLRILRAGAASYRDVRVDYHVGADPFRLVGRHSFTLCAPAGAACG
jgi:hypothetical protein